MDNNFYSKKLEGLKLISAKMTEIDRIFNDLCDLEDDQPCGDPAGEYHQLRVDLDSVNDSIVDLISSVAPLVEAARPKPVTAAQVMALYAASLR